MRSWILSILVAVLLSAAATWFLTGLFGRDGGGHGRGHGAASSPALASGCGGGCCPGGTEQ